MKCPLMPLVASDFGEDVIPETFLTFGQKDAIRKDGWIEITAYSPEQAENMPRSIMSFLGLWFTPRLASMLASFRMGA